MTGVIIDLDGTIIKSEIAIEKIFKKLLIKNNYLKLKSNWKDGISLGGEYLIHKAFGTSAINKPDILYEFRKEYKKIKHTKSDLYCGVLQFLKLFKKKGIKVFLCTNKPCYLVKKILNELRIKSYFSKIWCRNQLLLNKPSLQLANYIKNYFNNLGIENYIMIGDSEVDIKLSKFLGSNCKVWIFKNGYLTNLKNSIGCYRFKYDKINLRKMESILNK